MIDVIIASIVVFLVVVVGVYPYFLDENTNDLIYTDEEYVEAEETTKEEIKQEEQTSKQAEPSNDTKYGELSEDEIKKLSEDFIEDVYYGK